MSRPVSLLLLLSLLAIVPASLTRAQEAGLYEHFDVYDGDNFPRTEYANRRKQTLEKLKSGEGMLLRSAEVRNRSNDVDYEFRQRNNLLYLTGVTETQSALLLLPDGVEIDGKRIQEVLFVAERNPTHEIWEGIRMGPEVAAQVTGITTVLPYDKLAKRLEDLFPTLNKLYYDSWTIESIVDPVVEGEFNWPAIVRSILEESELDLEIEDAGTILNGMRAIKSEREIAMMQKAIDISAEGHREAMRMAKPGMFEYEFEASMEYAFRRLGAEDPGYPSIIGSGPNTCILHYNTNRRKSLDGELVLMDCGAEYHGYSADITRTFPVNGKFTPEQRAIYNLVLEAQTEAIKECKVGVQFWDPHKKAGQIISSGLVKLGIMKEGDDVRKYFMHGTSHFLGMDVHDVGDDYTLQPGMVLTVEPGIYIPEGSKCDPKWWNIGVRIEDDVLVTKSGSVNLSAGLERTADEIERLVGSKRK
ncbi:MAG: aminopeptidase P N-terminal domain-containing protein [Ignavibacteriae bacterium]|nr:aminopeptidase P N-terminal domain-containing protein [Ignavibacteriota bacterium]MCB9216423.1 aminopeptidase P N-terminal domain-containing protein [Ignavibacteria bacterium]